MQCKPYKSFCIVTLVDLSQRPQQLFERLRALAIALIGSEFALKVAHADRKTPADDALKLAFEDRTYKSVQVVSITPEYAEAELARLRNEAMRMVDANVVLLVDVDIFPDLQLFRTLAQVVEAGKRLAIAPCLYLSARGNRLIHMADGKKRIIDSALSFSPEFVMHWALPSSVMAFKREDYWAISGFDESYRGHGYEDFDYMLRLALYAHLIEPSSDLLIDRTYRAPLLSIGFRGALGRLCIPNLLDGNIGFHLHHEKQPESSYQMQRSVNAKIFQQKIRACLGKKLNESASSSVPGIVEDFFVECRNRGVHPERFYSLFDARPRHLLKPRSWLKRANRTLTKLLS